MQTKESQLLRLPITTEGRDMAMLDIRDVAEAFPPGEFIKDELAKWAPIIRDANVKIA